MLNTQSRALSTVSALALLLVVVLVPAEASKDEKQLGPKSENCPDNLLIEKSSAQTARFAQIPQNAHSVSIVAENAKVVVKRVAGISEISIASNCPRNWYVQGSLIRQAAFSGEIHKGSSLLADDLGQRAIVNGHVYMFPPGGMKGLKLGPDGVFMNNQPVDPLKGSDIPCNCSGTDYLEVSVPQSYTGDLQLGAEGKSQLSVDTWKDGSIQCVLLGNASFQANKLESLPKAAFDNKGQGETNISEVDAKIFVANISGQGGGSIHVKNGKAAMSNATVEGNGTIELHGNFQQLKKLVNGTGKIEVKP